jgi:hypothetical protein
VFFSHTGITPKTLELLVPLLHERLILVLAQRLLQTQRLIVAKQREQAIAAGFPHQGLGILLEADALTDALDTTVLRVGPRSARPHLPILLGHLPIQGDPQQTLHLLVSQDAFGGRTRLTRRAERPPPSGRLQSVQAGMGPLQTLLPALPVVLLLLRAALPDQAVALDAALRALHSVVDHVRPILPAWVGLALDLVPLPGVGLQVVAEPAVLRARAWHHGQETPLPGSAVSQVLARAQFAISHMQEVAVADDLPQKGPGVLVDLIVGGVAVIDLTMDRDGAVGRDGDAVEQLLPVGAVVLVVAEGDAWRATGLVGGGAGRRSRRRR